MKFANEMFRVKDLIDNYQFHLSWYHKLSAPVVEVIWLYTSAQFQNLVKEKLW